MKRIAERTIFTGKNLKFLKIDLENNGKIVKDFESINLINPDLANVNYF